LDKKKRRSLFTLYLTYFADYFSWGVAIAYLAVYITTDSTPFKTLPWNSHVALGIACAAFPIGEVIGSPILGDLSDWMGRKKVLLWGLWGSILSMALCAFSLWAGSFTLFLIGQFLVGFFAGKQAMVQASIVESYEKTKGQKLAFLSILGGVSWMLGPLLGSLLMEKPFTDYGGYIWPNLLAAFVYVLSLACTHAFFQDTYEPSGQQLSALKLFQNMGEIVKMTYKNRLFATFLLNLLGWYLLIVSLSDFLITRFQLSNAEVGIFNAYFSLCFTIGGVAATTWIFDRWNAKNILFFSILVGSFSLFFLFRANQIIELWLFLAIATVTEAWIYPAFQTVLSDHTSKSDQGKLFGLIGAANGACQFVASLILTGVASSHTIFTAALLFLISAGLLPLAFGKKQPVA